MCHIRSLSVTYQEASGHKYVVEDVLEVSSCLYLRHRRAMAVYNKELKTSATPFF